MNPLYSLWQRFSNLLDYDSLSDIVFHCTHIHTSETKVSCNNTKTVITIIMCTALWYFLFWLHPIKFILWLTHWSWPVIWKCCFIAGGRLERVSCSNWAIAKGMEDVSFWAWNFKRGLILRALNSKCDAKEKEVHGLRKPFDSFIFGPLLIPSLGLFIKILELHFRYLWKWNHY